ncbi:MAG: DUF1631 domain-containing protein [Pseudomonadales bacterium]|nr:DUF1631 domain-containing protein [Pseudomonadales bacterium]
MTDFSVPSQNNAGVKLPPLLEDIAALSMDQLAAAVARLLDAVDDHFFDLAEEAKTNSEQNFYFEAMRDVRVGRRGVEQSFRQNLENGFRVMCFSAIPEKSASNEPPVLVSDASGDLDEAISRIDRKFKATSAAELYKVTVRFDAINEDYQVLEENNALSPKNLCEYFNRSSKLLNLDSKSKHVLFKLFDRNVIRVLPSLLRQVNDKLSDAGVLPEFSGQMSSSVNEEFEPGLGVQSARAESVTDKNSQDTFTHLQNLLANGAKVANPEGDQVSESAGQALSKHELLEILSSLQRNIHLPEGLDAKVSRVDIRQQIYAVLAERQDHYEGGVLSREDEDVITLVEKLFNVILEDSSLSDLVKASLSRLQIPLVKLGLIDQSLFVEREHVGRSLVNELAKLGGNDRNKSEMARNILYSKVEEITQRIIREFNEDVSVFEASYNDLMLFYQRTETRADEMEYRAKIASDGKEKVELARSVISQNINLLKEGKLIPPVVDKLLNDEWSDLMLVALLKEGVPGDHWGDCLLTAEELIWSVQPEKDRAARQRLLQVVPHLLEKLKEGLATINFEPFAFSEMFAELEKYHLAVFGMQREPVKELETSQSRKDTSVTVNENTLELKINNGVESITGDIASITRQIINKSEQSRLDTVGEGDSGLREQPANASVENETQVSLEAVTNNGNNRPNKLEAEALVDHLNLGVWFEVHNQEIKGKYRCKLAAHLTGYNKYIFVNRRGEKVIERNRSSLVDAIVSGEMIVVQETQIFDRALQSVVSDLRNLKGTKS